ncbi:MAG: [protein-PII] uridylyltransferase, partial [Planctomycetota bacterium]
EFLRDSGWDGSRIARSLGRIFEDELYDTYAATLAGRGPVRTDHAVVLVGGTGRGELCPGSDADLLILKDGPSPQSLGRDIDGFVQAVWDRGIRLGHSVRTIAEALRDSREDVKLATALTGMRHLAGDPTLTERLRHLFTDSVVRKRTRRFVDACVEARMAERAASGGTPCLLEPDVKKGPGGLRDVHLIGWVGYARHATADLDRLTGCGLIGRDDYRRLAEGVDLLLRVRLELHAAAGRGQDLFGRHEQARLAERWGVDAGPGMLPVERLMKDYFQYVTAIRDVTDLIVERHRPRTWTSRLLRATVTRRLDGAFLVGPTRVDVASGQLAAVLASPARLVTLFGYLAREGVEFTTRVESAISVTIDDLPTEPPPDAVEAFVALLATDGSIGRVLRAMHRVGLLSYFIPGFEHARGLTQFSEYHSYTVDEHTLRCVEATTAFASDEGPVGGAIRAIDDLGLLRLALLLHDVGKGLEGDHSVIGSGIAAVTAGRLRLDVVRTERLVLLVREHLALAHAAFRRDTNDPALLADMARRVGDAGTLRLLFVLTACDLSGVGPGVWTDWKQELLHGLYDRLTGVLSGRPAAEQSSETVRRREAVMEFADKHRTFDRDVRDRIAERVDQLSPQYLAAVRRGQIFRDLLELDRVTADPTAGPSVTGEFDAETRTTVYRVVTGRSHAVGCISKTSGALAAKRLRVHEALIESTPEGAALDRYRVSDDDFEGPPPEWRIREVCRTITDALTGRLSLPALVPEHRYDDVSLPAVWSTPRVAIDTELSTRCTILDVFTVDRPGLLCRLTGALQRLGLSIELAKISTHLDQVVDVFYITDGDGRKVTDPDRLAEIRAELERAIESPPTGSGAGRDQ